MKTENFSIQLENMDMGMVNLWIPQIFRIILPQIKYMLLTMQIVMSWYMI